MDPKVDLPVEAVQLLYDVLGHFPHDPHSWSDRARRRLSEALRDEQEVVPPDPPELISGPQMRAFYAMARDLDQRNNWPEGRTKEIVKDHWRKESMRDFTRDEAGQMLDLLDADLTARGVTPA